jgi:RNA polymerase sigma-70 factor (ECF subfamily)
MATTSDFSQRVRECSERLSEMGAGALGALFDLTSDRLVRFAIALARNQHDAEDAVQTALVRVAREPRVLAAARCPWAYLLRIVRNEALVIARRKQRCSPAGNLADLVTVRRVDELEQEETHRAVWSALRTLPADQAEVVVLKIWEGMTFAQIGEILEASPNTIASRYQYAMAKLTQRLSRHEREVRRG